jgi:hypothetical protein
MKQQREAKKTKQQEEKLRRKSTRDEAKIPATQAATPEEQTK